MTDIYKGTRPLKEKDYEHTEKPRPLPVGVTRKGKMAVGHFANGPWAEESKRLQNSIISLMPDAKQRILLFTGVNDGEGSETVVIRFGLVLAAWGEQVLLIDACVREPSLHKSFGIERAPGTTELLSGKRTLPDVMHRSALKNLLIIPGGSPVNNPFVAQELRTLDAATDVMKGFADWIIFLGPPVNAYDDASALARVVDGVVLVVEAEKTRWEVARSAKERLERAGANIMGAVLNNRRRHIPGWIYRNL
jgi:capsular exopolysaccharide synthesis family protein